MIGARGVQGSRSLSKPVGDVMLELDGKQIYLVDDDAFFASVLEKYLLGSGADVRIFADSREGQYPVRVSAIDYRRRRA